MYIAKYLELIFKKTTIYLLKLYQVFWAPYLIGSVCRFYPTCSQYAIDAINKYGFIKGTYRAFLRLVKCHPFHPGGFDPV